MSQPVPPPFPPPHTSAPHTGQGPLPPSPALGAAAPVGPPPGAPSPGYGSHVGQAPPPVGSVPPPAAPPTARTGWVIAAFLLFWPLAIPALLASQRASRALGAGDLVAATREGDSARSWGIGAVVVGAIVQIGYVVTLVSFLTAGMFAATEAFDAAASPSPGSVKTGGSSTAEGDPAEETIDGDAAETTDGDAAQEATDVETVDKEFVDLAVGDCFVSDDLPEEVFTVPVMSCDVEHQSEVFAVTELEDGTYAGDDATFALAEEFCLGEFAGYVGTDYDTSELVYWAFYPSKDNWVWGDRTVQCVVEPYEGSVTGTLQGSGR